jgi:hypothetical protein
MAYDAARHQVVLFGVADAHRDNGKRFTAFLELERVARESLRFSNAE